MEGFSRAAAPGLKFGGGPKELRDYFLTLGEFDAIRDQDLEASPSLLDRLEDLQDRADTFIDRAINEP